MVTALLIITILALAYFGVSLHQHYARLPQGSTPARSAPPKVRARSRANESSPAFDEARFRQLATAGGGEARFVGEDAAVIRAALDGRPGLPEALLQDAASSGKRLELWMWDQIGPAQAFVADAYRSSTDFTEFAARLAAKGRAKWALHLYRAAQQLLK